MFYIKSTDGVKIAVNDYNCQGKHTIVLVHGWPLSHKIYEYQIPLLLECGFRVVAMDLRGFGQSDTPGCGYSYDQMAADIHQVIRQMGLRSFVLTGFSMGGAIVLRYMRLFKGFGVTKLILLSAAAPCWTKRPGFPYGLSKEYVNSLIELARTDRPKLCENFKRQLFASPHSEAVENWFEDVALSASGIGTIKAAVSLRDEDGRKDLMAVKVPATIIHGDKDEVVSNELARYQYDNICNSEWYNLKNSAHGIMYDELEEFNKIFIKAARQWDSL